MKLHNLSLNRVDFSILIPAIILVVISLATFYSLERALFFDQLIFFIASLVGYFVFINIDYRIFGYISKYLYIGMVIALLALFVIGFEAKGAVRWVAVFGVSIQLSEIIKPFFIIFLASFLTKNDSKSFKKFLIALLLIFPLFFLVLRQPDLGNALIYLASGLGMLFLYGFPILFFVLLGLMLILPAPLLYNLLHDYQQHRILSFINMSDDPSGTSYNAIQSLISIGSGGFFGKGFGESTQSILRFLPERHTDFIFATISESLGFVGGIVIVSLFVFLLYRIYLIYLKANDQFSKLVVMGCFFLLLTHAFFNIGMNIGILPIVGITLPFVSHGGSSLLTNFIILGILSSINYESQKRHMIEIK